MQRAYLDVFVPPCAHNDGVLRVRAKSHAADPFRVALLRDSILAVTQGIP